jgi:hypothetical protein
MAQISLSLNSALALYEYAQQVRQGSIDAGPLSAAYSELAASLDSICSTIPEWTAGASGTVQIAGPGWMVSYKEVPSDSDIPETALIDRDKRKAYVLNGDHRNAFQVAMPGGWDALKAAYDTLKAEHRSECSED